MKHLFIGLLALLTGLVGMAQKQDRTVTYLYDESSQPPEMFVDVTHLKAEILKIDPVKKYMETRSVYSFKTLRTSVDSLVLNSPGTKVTSVKMDAKDVKYRQADDKLYIYPALPLTIGSQHELDMELNTVCTKGMPCFTGWDDSTNTKRKQIWGFSLTNIFPDFGIKHDLLTTELTVTFDSKYKVYSNGIRIEERKNKDNTTTWHYKMNKEHYFGLLNLVIGDYDYQTFSTARGVPLEYWYYPDRKESFETTYRYSREMFSFFEDEMGTPYPWELYRQAPIIDCPFGAMETTTSTIYNDGMLVDAHSFFERNYINVNAHELTHQWFGNYTSYTNGENVWTSESFATYWAKKFEQAQFGEDQYQKVRSDELARVLAANKTDDYPVGSSKGSVPRWYPKGSLVIDMLRYVMGEKEFRTFIAYYLKKHAYSVVEWNDMKVAIRESTGQALDWFFDEWILKGGEPEYTISYKQMETLTHDRSTQVAIQQTHVTNDLVGFFKMPIKVQAYYEDGTHDEVTAQVEKEFTEVIIPNKEKKNVSFVVFDPNRNIVKQVKFKRTDDELISQLKHAANMIDRYDALLELKNTDVKIKRDALIEAFNKENFHIIRSEVVSQLVEDTNPSSITVLRQAIHDKDVNVRKAVSTNLKTIPAELQKDYEVLLRDSAYQVIIAALENLVNSFPGKADSYLALTAKTDGNMFHSVRTKWLEIDYQEKGDMPSLMKLRDFCDIDRYDNATVIASIQAMKRLDYLDATLVGYLFKAGKYWSGPPNAPAKSLLEYDYEQSRYKKMIKAEYAKLNADQKTQWKDLIK